MAGRIYRVPFALATVTNAGGDTDLWELTPADDKPIHIVGIRLGQTMEVGDAAEEGLDITIEHLAATVTSGSGSAVTPVPADPGISDLAAGFTAEINGATVATTSGTKTILESMSWNLRNSPFEIWFPDDERYAPTARQATALVIRKNTTVADDISFSGCCWVRED